MTEQPKNGGQPTGPQKPAGRESSRVHCQTYRDLAALKRFLEITGKKLTAREVRHDN